MSSKKFGYKKYLKPKEKKDISILKLFCGTFVLMLVVFTIIVNCFTPDVDVSIGDTTTEASEAENNIYLKKFVDNRLLEIQQEDQSPAAETPAENKSSETVTDEKVKEIVEATENNNTTALAPVELNVTVPEIKIITPEEAVQATVPVTHELNLTYRVYIGHYNTYDQVKIAKDIVNETDPELQPVIKEVNGGYTLQAGVFKNKDAAKALTTTLLNEHLPARMIAE